MNHFCTVCQNGKISQLVASKPPENKKQFTQLSDNRLVFFDSQRVEPGGEGAQEGRDGVQVQPVQVDELQAGAAGQVGECVAPPGAAHVQSPGPGASSVGWGRSVETVSHLLL